MIFWQLLSILLAMLVSHHIPYDKSHIWYARSNRKAPTHGEQIVWNMLKTRPLWYKFTRQKLLWPYIADFYCSKLLLIIEVDGISHEDKTNYDMSRDLYLGKMCIKTIRYEDWFLKVNPDMVYEDILRQIAQRKEEVKEKMICEPSLSN